MVTVFILAVSFFSAVPTFLAFIFSAFGLRMPAAFFYFGGFFLFGFLSFPFYASIDYTRIFENYLSHNVWYYKLRFLTIDITSSNFSPSSYLTECISHFPFFLVVNILGALAGYWIGKKHRIQLFGSKWWKIFWGLVGVTLIMDTVLPLYFAPGLVNANPFVWFILFGFAIILVETIFLSWLIRCTRRFLASISLVGVGGREQGEQPCDAEDV